MLRARSFYVLCPCVRPARTSLALRLPSRLYGTAYPPSFDHLWPKLVFTARKFLPVWFPANFGNRNKLTSVGCECTPVCCGCQDLIPIYCTNKSGSPSGIAQPTTNLLKQKYLLDLEYLNVFQLFVIYAAPRLCIGLSSLAVWKIPAERTGNSWPQPPQMMTHPCARPSTNGRLLCVGSVPRTRIFSQSGQLAH